MPADHRYTITLTDSTHALGIRQRVVYRETDWGATDAAERELRRYRNTHPHQAVYDGWRVMRTDPPHWTPQLVAEVRPDYDSRTPKAVPSRSPNGFPF